MDGFLTDLGSARRGRQARTPVRCEAPLGGRSLSQSLVGVELPDIELTRSPSSERFPLRELGTGWAVLYFYDGSATETHADAAEHRAFNRLREEFAERNVQILGVSSETAKEQHRTVISARVLHGMLADPELHLADALVLPTREREGHRRYCRVALVVRDRVIAAAIQVPVPARAASQVIAWMVLRGA